MYVDSRGNCQVEDYLLGLSDADLSRIAARLQLVAEHGPPRNDEQSKSVEGTRFFEFKAGAVRIFWRYASRRRIVMFYGFTKKSARTPRRHLALSHQYWDEASAEVEREDEHG